MSRNLREPRANLRPTEYPEFLAYRDAIRHAYWLHTEYNLTDDIHDFRMRASKAEKNAIRNTMLAIAQVEVSVKTFWGDLMKQYPKPEIGAVGYTFAESEVRHQDAYAHLLEVLGLNADFTRLTDIPALNSRLQLLSSHIRRSPAPGAEHDGREHALMVLLFSAFVEHASLFAQFLIMKSFDRYRNRFKGVANIVEATSKEEQIHAMFGYRLIGVLREENPEWFDEDFTAQVQEACAQARAAEGDILDWIFEAGELEFLPRAAIDAFVDDRFNTALRMAGLQPMFTPDPHLLQETVWFEEEVLSGKHTDFFHKRPTTYSRKTKAITGADLFA